MSHFQTLLRDICADPDRRVKRLRLLDEVGERQVLGGWNDTRAAYPHAEAYHRLFEVQAERTPDAVAVVFEGEEFTYRDLNAGANRLARYLRKHGIGPETTVAICLERSARMITALLGVMKAGGAYVPLDTASPPERLRFSLEDCDARVVLAQEKWREPLSESGAEVISLDGDWKKIERESADNLEGGAGPNNLAYVIYTSGSTGRPKGVCVEQRQLLNYVRAVSEKLSLPEGASFATVSTLAADLGNTMIFPALCLGGSLHVMAEERIVNPDALADYFGSHRIDCLKVVPSHLEALLTAQRPEQVLPRRRLILGGEAARTSLLARLGGLAEPACEIFNHYGPTETTVGVLTYQTPADSLRRTQHNETALPLGRPIPNAQVYLLDKHLQPVPPGVRGELYVGGEGVARGYHRRPDLTAERFIPDPFGGTPGARLYRTGDLGRYLPNGDIQFLGRSDDQVKVRGLRIELGEIEAALVEHEAVRETVVVAREDVPGERGLVAYVVTQPETAPGVTELRDHLRRSLPEYMQPAAFVMVDKLPLTPNGKIDRRALPAPDGTRPELGEVFVAPRTPAEERLAAIWAEVLRLERVGVHDNFFNLGGNSLLGTQITARVRDRFRVELTLRSLFEAPTLAGLAAVIAERQPEPESPAAAAVRPASDKSPDQILAALDQLPDEEVDSLLDQLLAEEEAQ
jgi:amino acid adenylation domain-containing protein